MELPNDNKGAGKLELTWSKFQSKTTHFRRDSGGITYMVGREGNNIIFANTSRERGLIRAVELDLRPLKDEDMMHIFVTWSPNEIGIIARNQSKTTEIAATEKTPSYTE